MKFKVGDKIKFLNEVGGGIIKKIISPTMVSVTVEDGFDIPIMTNEIILAESSNPQGAMFNRNFSVPDNSSGTFMPEENSMNRISKLQKFSSLNAKPYGVYLAYIPQDQIWLLKDEVDLYIVNYTGFDILYSLILENNGKFEGIDYGCIDPFSKIHIQTINRDDLTDWINGFVQILFFKDEDSTVRMPLHSAFNIKPVRFQKKDAYFSTNFMEEKGLLIYLGQSVSVKEFTQMDLQKDIQTAQIQNNILKSEKFIDKYKTDRLTAEVDLHIESIVDDHSKMSNSEIIDVQKNLFIRCLESAIEEKLHKVIFIHGVGNGSLKREITAILKQYTNVHYFDASMQKYGCGATEVLIKNNDKDL